MQVAGHRRNPRSLSLKLRSDRLSSRTVPTLAVIGIVAVVALLVDQDESYLSGAKARSLESELWHHLPDEVRELVESRGIQYELTQLSGLTDGVCAAFPAVEEQRNATSGPAEPSLLGPVLIRIRGNIDPATPPFASEIHAELFLPQYKTRPRIDSVFYQPSWLSVIPPLLTIFLALVSRWVIFSIFMGILAGAILVTSGDIALGLQEVVLRYGKDAVWDPDRLFTLLFIASLIAMFALLGKAGGIAGLIQWVTKRIRDRRSARLGVAFSGAVVFFDDYASSVMVGSATRSIAGAYGISREKLAYFVDSLAAPVASLIFVSTWVAYQAGEIGGALERAGLVYDQYAVLLQSLPLRAYCLLTLVMILVVAWMGRDFGPMLRAERTYYRRSVRGAFSSLTPQEVDESRSGLHRAFFMKEGLTPRASLAILPIALVLILVAIGLIVHGSLNENVLPLLVGANGVDWSYVFSLGYLQQALSEADTLMVPAVASTIVLVLVVFWFLASRRLTGSEIIDTMYDGLKSIGTAGLILALAWTLQEIVERMDTAHFLLSAMGAGLSGPLLISILFLLACAISFGTGTSWGTMAILLPVAVPLAVEYSAVNEAYPTMILVILTIVAVLEGAIFGDHVSPISDTTILTATSTGTTLDRHVQTQTPYAVIVLLTSFFFVILPISAFPEAWILPILGYALAILLFIFIFKRFGRQSSPLLPTTTPDVANPKSQRLERWAASQSTGVLRPIESMTQPANPERSDP